MQTQAYFDNIQAHLLSTLGAAEHRLCVAVAWFTDAALLAALERQAQQGRRVELILVNDHINRGDYGLDFSGLLAAGASLLWIGDGHEGEELMHNKFVVLDDHTVITGSYNWSRKAQRNHENITITRDSPELAAQFLAEFAFLQRKYGQADSPDFGKILKRVEILKSTLALADEEDIEYQALKLRKSLPNGLGGFPELAMLPEILGDLQRQAYSQALSRIEAFIQHFNRIALYEDAELNALKLEIRAMEICLASLEDEKTEIEKLLHNFQVRHDRELGALLLALLAKRKAKAAQEAQDNPEDEAKQQRKTETEEDYSHYQQSYDQHKEEKIQALNPEEKKNIKKMYREASKLCHPDIVAEEFKEEAQALFVELDQAYKAQDFAQVQETLTHLKKGIFRTQSQTVSEKESLKAALAKMERRITQIVEAVQVLKASDTFQKVSALEDWDAYFAEMKEALEEELAEY